MINDLTISMIWSNDSGTELARREVHLQILPTRVLSLSAQGNGELSETTIQNTLTRLLQGANVIRRDRDGLDAHADVSVPVTFRLGAYRGRDTDPAHIDWRTTSSGSPEAGDIFRHMELFDGVLDIYLVDEITNAGGFARSGGGMMVIPATNSNRDVIAHEWLHAFGDTKETIGDANDNGHICIDNHLMHGSGCSESLNRGSDVRESEKLLFQIY